ncbi:carboxylesterase/lipase family protein [Phenylobacterium sp.]|uniref:carboxylesterase/lipase family protein n=1 Tax=Phenylobacterium sp. TaxID=1871053 RepID=UPI002F3F60DE
MTRSPLGRLGAVASICGFVLASVAAALPAEARSPIVVTRSGEVSGLDVDGVATFKGIPFAAPPVGRLRWRPPQPAAGWKGVLKAEAFGSPCMQGPAPGPPTDLTHVSEDCLTVNVWSPPHRAGERLPVMVDIPGGGFFGGSSAFPAEDGAAMARRGVVVVSFNYRLGVFGFMAHPALSKEDPSGTSGAYGLLDQIAALKWVQANIASFGGDPKKVTIMGCSAGGVSVLYLMASPLAKGLFRSGISESPGYVWYPQQHLREPAYGLRSAEAEGLSVGADIEALRHLSAAELLAKAQVRTDLQFSDRGIEFWPIVDGHVLPDEPMTLFDAGKVARVPLLVGTTADDGSVFSFGMPIKTVEDWRVFAQRRYPAVSDTLLSLYPATKDAEVQPAAIRYVTDWLLVASARSAARAMSVHHQPVWRYEFTRATWKVFGLPPIAGSFHSSEMVYALDNFAHPSMKISGLDATDQALGAAMSGAWVRFVKTGDPNGPGLATWPTYDPKARQVMEFGDKVFARQEANSAKLNAYDKALATLKADRRRRLLDWQ